MFASARQSKGCVRCRAAKLNSQRPLRFVPTGGLLATLASPLAAPGRTWSLGAAS